MNSVQSSGHTTSLNKKKDSQFEVRTIDDYITDGILTYKCIWMGNNSGILMNYRENGVLIYSYRYEVEK